MCILASHPPESIVASVLPLCQSHKVFERFLQLGHACIHPRPHHSLKLPVVPHNVVQYRAELAPPPPLLRLLLPLLYVAGCGTIWAICVRLCRCCCTGGSCRHGGQLAVERLQQVQPGAKLAQCGGLRGACVASSISRVCLLKWVLACWRGM